MLKSKLASGELAILDTPDGERFRLSLSKSVRGLKASVTIDRGKVTETLLLNPTQDSRIHESSVAPAEPHEFVAKITLKSKTQAITIPFEMKEPDGHHH